MARIIVVADPSSGTQVVLEERVATAHLESNHSCAQLVERLGWAIVDAEELERGGATARTLPEMGTRTHSRSQREGAALASISTKEDP